MCFYFGLLFNIVYPQTVVCLQDNDKFVSEFVQRDDLQKSGHNSVYSFYDTESFVRHKSKNFLPKRNALANRNLGNSEKRFSGIMDGEVTLYEPGQPAPNFEIWGLKGKVAFPSALFENKSIIIHMFDPASAFLECLWTSDEALSPLLETSNNSVLIFIPKSAEVYQKYGAVWMHNRTTEIIARKTKK